MYHKNDLEVTILKDSAKNDKAKQYSIVDNAQLKTHTCWISCVPGKHFAIQIKWSGNQCVKVHANIYLDGVLLSDISLDFSHSWKCIIGDRPKDNHSNERVRLVFPEIGEASASGPNSDHKGEIGVAFYDYAGDHYTTFMFKYQTAEFLYAKGHMNQKTYRQHLYKLKLAARPRIVVPQTVNRMRAPADSRNNNIEEYTRNDSYEPLVSSVDDHHSFVARVAVDMEIKKTQAMLSELRALRVVEKIDEHVNTLAQLYEKKESFRTMAQQVQPEMHQQSARPTSREELSRKGEDFRIISSQIQPENQQYRSAMPQPRTTSSEITAHHIPKPYHERRRHHVHGRATRPTHQMQLKTEDDITDLGRVYSERTHSDMEDVQEGPSSARYK